MNEDQKKKLDGILWSFTDRKNVAKERFGKRSQEQSVNPR